MTKIQRTHEGMSPKNIWLFLLLKLWKWLYCSFPSAIIIDLNNRILKLSIYMSILTIFPTYRFSYNLLRSKKKPTLMTQTKRTYSMTGVSASEVYQDLRKTLFLVQLNVKLQASYLLPPPPPTVTYPHTHQRFKVVLWGHFISFTGPCQAWEGYNLGLICSGCSYSLLDTSQNSIYSLWKILYIEYKCTFLGVN